MTKTPERRRSTRRPIVETFSLFVTIPRKGPHRLAVHDLSEHGMGFDLDTAGEDLADFPVSQGESLEICLYLNQSLFLPLTVEVVRLESHTGLRRAGAVFRDLKSQNHKAFVSFLAMLDSISEIAQVAPTDPL